MFVVTGETRARCINTLSARGSSANWPRASRAGATL